jgi:hypothetical protein
MLVLTLLIPRLSRSTMGISAIESCRLRGFRLFAANCRWNEMIDPAISRVGDLSDRAQVKWLQNAEKRVLQHYTDCKPRSSIAWTLSSYCVSDSKVQPNLQCLRSQLPQLGSRFGMSLNVRQADWRPAAVRCQAGRNPLSGLIAEGRDVSVLNLV